MDNSEFNYAYQYCNWHSDTEESCNADIQFAQELFKTHNIFPKDKDSKVLEIGCGMGRFLLMLKQQGYKNLTGIDIDQSQIDVAKNAGLNVFLSDAIQWLESTTEKFDVIYFFDVLEHIEKSVQLKFLKYVHSHLNDDGMIAFTVPNAIAPSGMFYRYIDFTHVISYTDISLNFILNNANFHYIQVRPQHKESKHILEIKQPWAKIYKYEFGLQDVILTPNLVCVALKNDEDFRSYIANAPVIENDYLNLKKESQLQRFWRHLKTFKF